jgi:hypothetical protein
MVSAIRRGLGLAPGERKTFAGPAAAAFAQRLDKWAEGDVIGDGWEDFLADSDDDDDDD